MEVAKNSHAQLTSILGFAVLPETRRIAVNLFLTQLLCERICIHTCARVHVCNSVMASLRHSGSGVNDKSKFSGLGLDRFSQPCRH